MHILVCEDQDSIRHMLEVLIRARGFRVTSVAAGADALHIALMDPPDLVLLDLMLPGDYNGLEVCRRLRLEPATRNVPILVVSALDDDAWRAQASEAGATTYYLKPFSPTALLREIDRLRPPSARPSTGPSNRPSSTGATSSAPSSASPPRKPGPDKPPLR